MNIKRIPLDCIHLEDERFRISYNFSLDRLLLSIKKIGLINPLLITPRDDNMVLVSGWKRVFACLELSLTDVPVRVLKEENDGRAFLLSFYDNLATRHFSVLEKAEILKKLKLTIGDEKDIVRNYMPFLDIPATLDYLDLYLRFSRLEPDTKKVIQEKNMPFSVLSLLVEFRAPERRLLIPLLLPLGMNKQKEFLEGLIDITERKGITAKNVFEGREFKEILDSYRMASLQKSDRVLDLLKKQRSPRYSSWKEAFDSSLRRMRWPKKIAVEPSPFFEEEEFSVSFKFKNQDELKEKIEMLRTLTQKKDLFRKPESE